MDLGYLASCSHIGYHSSVENPRATSLQLWYRATLPHVELLYLFSHASHQPGPT